jgi:lipopolysaccharide/colanic/teichoic acid biosynthesis glycosyltransferase
MVPVWDVVLRGDVRSQRFVDAGAGGARPTAVRPPSREARRIRLLVIGDAPEAARFVEVYNADGGAGRMRLAATLTLAELDGLDTALERSQPDRIVLLDRSCSRESLQALLDACVRRELPLQVPEYAYGGHPVTVLSALERPVYAVHPSAVRPHAYRLKRVFDVTAAATLLIVLSPLFVAAGALSRLGSPGPAIYVSWRIGVGEVPFPCYKFRTMHVGADVQQEELESRNEADGCLFKIKDDPRVTRFGRFLRRTSLDELPQLVDVLAGHMSIVGPRPLPLRDAALMDPRFRSRHAVLPGMTGPWQVSGRSSLTAAAMMELDLDYLRTWSLRTDLGILLRTFGVVVRGKGAC